MNHSAKERSANQKAIMYTNHKVRGGGWAALAIKKVFKAMSGTRSDATEPTSSCRSPFKADLPSAQAQEDVRRALVAIKIGIFHKPWFPRFAFISNRRISHIIMTFKMIDIVLENLGLPHSMRRILRSNQNTSDRVLLFWRLYKSEHMSATCIVVYNFISLFNLQSSEFTRTLYITGSGKFFVNFYAADKFHPYRLSPPG